MVTKRPTTTLLNKFTHLFRKSGNDSADPVPSTRTDLPAETADSLKRLFKSKRRNDAMRVYELNQLRTIIRGGRGLQPHNILEAAMASAQTRTSGMGGLERTSILNKIDGAEAHLEQWWGSASGHAALATVPLPVDSTAGAISDSDSGNDMDLDFTGMTDLAEDSSQARYPASGPVPFTDDEIAQSPVDIGLRDAALLYAEGEFEAAESTLSALLHDQTTDSEAAQQLTAALFDVYRCAGMQDRFDALALDYASRFGRSPAEWFVYDDPIAAGESAHLAATSLTANSAQTIYWTCPALLDEQAIAEYVAHQAGNSGVCAINWISLQDIDPATSSAFAKIVTLWSQTPLELQWRGIDSLLAALQMCRVSGKVLENEPWWLIELDMLCLLQTPQAFEDLALEYCVTFEVSPPSWKQAACILVDPDAASEVPEFVATLPSAAQESEPAAGPAYAIFELSGNITGHNPPALHQLREASRAAKQINVSCSRLGRIDINAAAKLLSWAQESNDRGCTVQFSLLPRLVQVYFHMLGMHKLASLSAGAH